MNDTDLEITEDIKNILDKYENSYDHMFITGKAGTGKSSLIKHINKKTSKKLVLLAPTAVAAQNIGGKTIHSFFNFPFHVITENDVKKNYFKKKLINTIDVILIDEVSMLRPDIIDAINLTLQVTRNNKSPFGGVQMIFVGDLYQLPPVITNDEYDVMAKLYPDGLYFFNSNIMNKIHLQSFELKKVFRQLDKNLINLLDKVRKATISDDDLRFFNTRLVDECLLMPEEVLTLSTNNHKVNGINSSNLNNIDSKEYTYKAEIDGKFSGLPVDENLKLKVGAQVMLVKNNGKNWSNGTLATIEKLAKNEITIKIKEKSFMLDKEKWERFEYSISDKDKKITTTITATFTQYPVKLAWATTIHKSQGQTYDNVILDMDHGAFAHGQTYVALSRLRTLDGLFLMRPLKISDFIFDEDIRKFLNNTI